MNLDSVESGGGILPDARYAWVDAFTGADVTFTAVARPA